MLAPTWTQPKIGPLLRGETDPRYYTGLFDNSGYVRGISKYWLLLRAQRVAEPEAEAVLAASRPSRPTLLVFSGLEGNFSPLVGHRDLLRARLHAILARPTRARLRSSETDFFVGVHFRRGDKPTLRFGQYYPRMPSGGIEMNAACPTEWFVRCIQGIRKAIGRCVSVRIFSDAHEEELKPLLRLPNVHCPRQQSSIVDMLLLARSRVLIGTGGSSFSMWPTFLGSMPTIWYPETRSFYTGWQPSSDFEAGVDGSLPAELVCRLRQMHDCAARVTTKPGPAQ